MKLETEEQQLEAVKQNGYAIIHIKNPSEAVQLEAVMENGHAIQFIDSPSEEVQLAAVRQNGHAIKNIENLTKNVLKSLVKDEEVMKNNSTAVFIFEKIKLMKSISKNNLLKLIEEISE
jgi:hypothetical protein